MSKPQSEGLIVGEKGPGIIHINVNVPVRSAGGYVQPKARTEPADRRLRVNKRTHCIKYENETEEEVTILIEPKVT